MKRAIFNKLSILFFLIFGLAMFSACGVETVPDADPEIIHTGFYVDGTMLRDLNGNPFIMRGINMPHCWYKEQDAVSLDAIAATNANCVRVVCSTGARWDRTTSADLENIIDEVNKRGMVAILEVHDATGSNEISDFEDMALYWCEMADILLDTEDRVIINIANEWYGSYGKTVWKEGYVEVIPRLREAGIKNTIMVDAGGWGQNGSTIKKYGIEVFESDELKNTMFSVHMYGTAGKSATTIRNNLKGVTDQNLCVCVGEFGYTHSDGNVDEEYLIDYCYENNIGFLPWSWKGNSGGVEYLDLALEWDGSVLSSDWGEYVINGTNGIRESSKKVSYLPHNQMVNSEDD